MIRSAVLVSGKGTKLQSLLDSVFFGEIPELQLVAVISSDAGAYALKRARNAGIETVVVEPSVFPNDTSYDMAIRNKLKDMDIELVINAGFYPGIGRETAKSCRGKVIAVQPSLVPAFETLRGDAVHEAVLARGLKVTGATPLVGMLWLMVSIFAPFSAKIARTDDSTPCRSSSSRLNVTRWPRDIS